MLRRKRDEEHSNECITYGEDVKGIQSSPRVGGISSSSMIGRTQD